MSEKPSCNCLLIEDDRDDQEIFAMCVAEIDGGIICRACDNGVEALTLLSSPDYAPDIIFLDVNMPKMNGLDCLKAIRAIPRLRKTKIYVYSTTSEASVVKKARDFGADDYIVKPIKPAELKDELVSVFNMCKHLRKDEQQHGRP